MKQRSNIKIALEETGSKKYGVNQRWMLYPYLLEKGEAKIKIGGQNTNRLRYVDSITLLAEKNETWKK